jgi:hypothetical protein
MGAVYAIGGSVANYYSQFATFIVSGTIGLLALLMLAIFYKTLQQPNHENT